MEEIRKSKDTYSSYKSENDKIYDIILPDISRINRLTIAEAKRNKAARLSKKAHEDATIIAASTKQLKPKASEFEISYKKIKKTDVVFRIMMFDHIPLEEGRVKNPKTTGDHHEKLPFPPYQHFRYNDDDELICVGKSHWKGDLDTGEYSKDHGSMTNAFAQMIIKLCDRFGSRSNYRGYCVDESTEALTKRGWLSINDITTNDIILSSDNNQLKWSSIKSIFRDEYDGMMHKITNKTGVDMLVTPNHKLLTNRGLVEVEYLKEKDRLILMTESEKGIPNKIYSDDFIKLLGWILTKGCYDYRNNSICIYQNEGIHSNDIEECLINLNYKFSKTNRKNRHNMINFRIFKKFSKIIDNVLPNKKLTMNFILSLTNSQKELLIETMIKGDGWNRNKSYCQKDREHIDIFQALCILTGKRSNFKLREIISYDKPTQCHTMNIFSKRKNSTLIENLNFHGGKRNGNKHIGKGKIYHPNIPTTHYKGMVWCPETEYGTFVARRNGTVYITGNTYNDEMRGQAIIQLVQVGLQFDESKSQNPFAYMSQIASNSFKKVLNSEKRHQDIRDDILEENNMTPSYTRQSEHKGQIHENNN